MWHEDVAEGRQAVTGQTCGEMSQMGDYCRLAFSPFTSDHFRHEVEKAKISEILKSGRR